MKNLRVILLLLIPYFGFSQSDSTYSGYSAKNNTSEIIGFWDKVYAGGDVMLFGGTGNFYLNISPMMGFRPNNGAFSYGIGATYQYTSFYDNLYGYGKVSYSLYGIRGFVRQQLGKMFFLHGEFENYFTEGTNIFTGLKEWISIPCANAFVGYKNNFSDYSYYYLMLGYEFIGDRNAVYAYPVHPIVFKVGYIFDIKGK